MPQLTIPKTYHNAEVLLEADLDEFKDSTETLINNTQLDSENIQVGGITASQKIIDGTIVEAVIAGLAITEEKILDSNITNAKILDTAAVNQKFADLSITNSKLETINQTGSDFSVSLPITTLNGSIIASITIATSGRPIIIFVDANSSTKYQEFSLSRTSTAGSSLTMDVLITMRRDGIYIAEYPLRLDSSSLDSNGNTNRFAIPMSSIFMFDTPTAGTYNYTLLVTKLASAPIGSAYNVTAIGRLKAYEVL